MEKLTKTPGMLELAQAVNTLADEIYQDTGMHTTESINTETGVHGLRYYDGVLAYKDGDIWVPISAGGGAVLPPNPVTNLSLTPGDGYVKIMWADPSDNAWVGTKVVRKEGGYPKSPTDGIVVIDSQNRNAYAVNPLIDAELTNGTTYYYHIFSYTSGGVCNTDVSGRGECSPVAYATYGVRIDTTNSNPETAVTYIEGAVGMTPGSVDWDEMPIFKDIKPCVLKDGQVQYYLNLDNFAQKADGTVSTISGADTGDVMIEFPKTGFKIVTTGDFVEVQITDNPDLSSKGFHYYAHTRTAEGDREKMYIGAYLAFTDFRKLYSLSGKTPPANYSMAAAIGYANNRGNGYDIFGFYQLTLIQCLYLVKYKNLDSQSAVGMGYTVNNSAVTTTGSTNAKGMCYGETTGKLQMKLFGIEDLWGNLDQWIGGLCTDSSRQILTAFENFNDNGAGYINRGDSDSNIATPGYVLMSKVQGTTEKGFVAKEGIGSSGTYFCDLCAFGETRLASFGGYSKRGSGAGIFHLGLYLTSAHTSTVTGTRLMYL